MRSVLRSVAMAGALATLGGCACGLKEKVGQEATSIVGVVEPSLALVDACKSANETACSTIKENLGAIQMSAKRLQDAAK